MKAPLRVGPIILVRDDDTEVCRTLQRAGISTIAVTFSEGFHLLARHHHPDLILLNLRLVDADGRDLLVKLRSDPSTSRIPVLIIAEERDALIRRNCLELGALDVEDKPFDYVFVRQVLRHARRSTASRYVN